MAISLDSLPITSEAVDEVSFDSYVDASEYPPPKPEGIYTFRQKKAEIEKFDQNTGVVSFLLNHERIDDQGNSLGDFNFDRVSTKVFERSGTKVSMAADHLRALGNTDRPRNPQEWGKAILSGDGQSFKAATKWDGFCKHKGTPQEVENKDGFTVRGEKKFPTDASGQRVPEMECPVCKQTIIVREKIDRRLPKA